MTSGATAFRLTVPPRHLAPLEVADDLKSRFKYSLLYSKGIRDDDLHHTLNNRGVTMKRVALHFLSLIAVCACGCGGGIARGGNAEPPQVSGSWTYSATYSINLGAHGTVTCSISGVQVRLGQSESSVSGSAHGGRSDCDSPSFDLEMGTAGDPIVIRGTLDQNSVRFEGDGFVLLSHRGTVSGDVMRGTVTGTGNLASVGSITVTGNWSASR